jgi:hypothetical protein
MWVGGSWRYNTRICRSVLRSDLRAEAAGYSIYLTAELALVGQLCFINYCASLQ